MQLPYDFEPTRSWGEDDEVALENTSALPIGVVLAAWVVVLSRLANTSDIAINVGSEHERALLHIGVRADEAFTALVDRILAGLTSMREAVFAFATEAGVRDLELVIEPCHRIILRFTTRLFHRATVERFGGNLRSVLEQISRAPDTRIYALGVLEPTERELLVTNFNATAAPFPREATMVSLFAEHVRERPSDIAIEDACGTFTFAEVDRRSAIVAAELISRGVAPSDVVMFAMERRRDLLVGILGIQRAGAAYLPIDPATPEDRVSVIARDSGARLLVSDARSFGLDHVLMWDAIDWNRARDAPSRATATGIAYVIYTSGSTGIPKGVMIEHRSVVNFLTTSQRALGVDADDRILWVFSFAFDASVEQYGLGILTGARIVVASTDILFARDSLEAFAIAKGITQMGAAPLLIAGLEPKRPLAFRRMIVGGDVCPVAVAMRWRACQPLFNEYGPTETTIASTRQLVATEDLSRARIPIGRPIANTRIYILDWTGNLAPLGAVGEMYIAGAGVARGYLGNPRLTAERFVPDLLVGGERMYRTGDLARWLPEGAIDFLGRADDQVKIRGFRVELGEIEAVLRQHPAVTDAAVALREYAGGNRLFGYIVAQSAEASPAALRNYLARALPAYMVPDAIMALDALPLTISGKLDRNRLPMPSADAYDRAAYTEPTTPVERRLAALWSEVLALEPIGTGDSFFALGGDSLQIARVAVGVQHAFGVALSLRTLLVHATLGELAAEIDRDIAAGRVTTRKAVAAVARLSATEGPACGLQPYWFACHEDDPAIGFPLVLQDVWRIAGPIDPSALECALAAVSIRHEVLRTTYERDGVLLRQLVCSPSSSAAPIFSFEERTTPPDLAELVRTPLLDLRGGPVARLRSIRLASDDHIVVVAMHHIMCDGPSSAVFYRDLDTAYRASLANPSADPATVLPPLPLQFLDVAAYLSHYTASPAGQADREFWAHRYREVEPLATPVDFPRDEVDAICAAKPPYVAGFPQAIVADRDASDLAGLVHAAIRREHVTYLGYFLAGLARLLHCETGQTDIALNTSLNLRPFLGADGLIGGFNNPFFVRADLSGQISNRELLHQIRDDLSQAYDHALVPVMPIVPPHAGRLNLGFGGAGDSPSMQLGSAMGTAITMPFECHASFDLRPNVTIDATTVAVELEYNPLLFRRETAQRLCASYLGILRAMAEDRR